MNYRQQEQTKFTGRGRRFIIFLLFFAGVSALLVRAVYLQHYQRAKLQDEGSDRYLREVTIPAHRGLITDRNGALLAISTPVYSVSIDPRKFDLKYIDKVAKILDLEPTALQLKIRQNNKRHFFYLERHIKPKRADALRQLNISYLYLDQEYKRYYPTGEVSAHVVGVTNRDGVGIEGVEKAFDKNLRSAPGAKQILRDGKARTVETVKLVKQPIYGSSIQLSLDQRIQYHAYRSLKDAIDRNNAKSGSIVVVNAQTGEIIAAVNQPSFNPNDRRLFDPEKRRNRTLTDVFEPGSTIKPMIIATLLDNGYLNQHTVIDTSPGYYQAFGKQIEDIHNFGKLDATGIIVKSSNVGISKVVKDVPREALWKSLYRIGFGQAPGTGFPGEAGGVLRYHTKWQAIDQAIMSYGYGVSVSPLQLAQAYTTLANDGWQPNLSFIKGNPHFHKTQVFKPETARMVRSMLQRAVSKEGTGSRAKIKGFTTAGKTGTIRKSVEDKGSDNKYISVFAGFAPVDNPGFVAVVMIDTPDAEDYYGSKVAAPVFSKVISRTLRLMNIPYDEQLPTGFSDIDLVTTAR